MSETQTAPEPSPAPVPADTAPRAGFFEILIGIFTEPRKAFEAVKAQSGRWWLPLIALLAVNSVLIGVWLAKVDTHQFVKTQIEESGRADKIPADRFDDVVDTQARYMKPITWGFGTAIPVLATLVVAAVLLFVFRFFYEGQVTFTQSLAVVSWTYLAVGLVTVPLIIAVMAAKGDWNLDPGSALGANLTLLLDKGQTAHWLYSLAGSIDLFTMWTVFLMACGYGVLTRKSTSAAFWGVLIPWLIFTVIKVGVVALTRG